MKGLGTRGLGSIALAKSAEDVKKEKCQEKSRKEYKTEN